MSERPARKIRPSRGVDPAKRRTPAHLLLAHLTLEDQYLTQAARLSRLGYTERNAVRWSTELMAVYWRVCYGIENDLPWDDYRAILPPKVWAPDEPIERLRMTHSLDGAGAAALTSIAFELSIGIRFRRLDGIRDQLAGLLDVEPVPLPV
jgi:hypothetical protein